LFYIEFGFSTPFEIIGDFSSLFVMSLIVGLTVGLLCTVFLKKMKYFKLNRVQECCIIIFFAYFSYSSIISLLFCAIFMSHYAFYNISFQAREESSVAAKIMSSIAEAFIYTYLGLTFISIYKHEYSMGFIISELFIIIIGRYVSIYSLSTLLK
jgi:NhaP-type Na+/H+ or K+/H+ antiporter